MRPLPVPRLNQVQISNHEPQTRPARPGTPRGTCPGSKNGGRSQIDPGGGLPRDNSWPPSENNLKKTYPSVCRTRPPAPSASTNLPLPETPLPWMEQAGAHVPTKVFRVVMRKQFSPIPPANIRCPPMVSGRSMGTWGLTFTLPDRDSAAPGGPSRWVCRDSRKSLTKRPCLALPLRDPDRLDVLCFFCYRSASTASRQRLLAEVRSAAACYGRRNDRHALQLPEGARNTTGAQSGYFCHSLFPLLWGVYSIRGTLGAPRGLGRIRPSPNPFPIG